MEEVLKDATRLLQNGEPEEALLLLNQLSESTAEREQLKTVCRQALSEQYLWLLNDAVKENRTNEIKAYVSKYLHLIGKDERIAKYEVMINKSSVSNVNQQQASNDPSLKNGGLALIPIIFLILSLLLSAFWGKITEWDLLMEWSYKLNLNTLTLVSTFLEILYIVSATITFWKIKELYKPNRNLKTQTIWLFIGSALQLIATTLVITEMVWGFHLSWLAYGICSIVGYLSLFIFLVKKFTESIKLKSPLIIAIVATGLLIVDMGVLFLDNTSYTVFINGYYSIRHIYHNVEKSLMLISFIMLFIMSQRTKNKQYGTN